MRLFIKKTEWYANRRDGSTVRKENEFTFNSIEKEKNLYWADFFDADEEDISFDFMVKEVNKDSVVLEVSGDAGCKFDRESFNYISKLITIKLNETKFFQTKTKDFGFEYEVSFLEEEKQENLEK
ncbi:MAG: hypothetical protein E7359_02990 [Clostridiales bacterium]|nr:hypothetical protein [Clostridiales bacterium]